MSRTFFIADPHFGHSRVLAYDGRPFANIDEMDREMVKRWNKAVKANDTVWLLGDLCLSTNSQYITQLVGRLNGRKNLVMGNHDKKSVDFYYKAGFARVYDHSVLLHDRFILSHKPVYLEEGSQFFNIHGHVHNHELYPTESDRSCCVSCCRWDYRPVRLTVFDSFMGGNDQ